MVARSVIVIVVYGIRSLCPGGHVESDDGSRIEMLPATIARSSDAGHSCYRHSRRYCSAAAIDRNDDIDDRTWCHRRRRR